MKLRKDRVLVSRLELSHPLLKILNIQPSEFYKKDFIHFRKHYDFPVVFVKHGNYTVISNIEEVMAVRNAGLSEIDVLIAEDFNEDELPRYINHRAYYKYKNSSTVKYDLISFLEDHLMNNKYGKKWAEEIQGDMKKKLATIIGVSETQIQNIRQIGNADRRYLKDIDEGKKTLVDTLAEVKKVNASTKSYTGANTEIKETSQMEKNIETGTVNPVVSPVNLFENFKINRIKIYNDRNDEIDFSYSGDTSQVMLNGNALPNYSVKITDRIGEQSFKNLSSDENYLLHLSLGINVDKKVPFPDKVERSILTPEISKHSLIHA